MKNFLKQFTCLVVNVIGLVSISQAQIVIPNAGFEQWDSSGSPAPFNWLQPTDWSSTNPVTEFIGAGISKTTDSHSGNFASQIRTLNVFGTNRAGGLVCGKAKTETSPSYTIFPITGGQTVTGKPINVRGFYKFSSVTSGDSAWVIVINKKWNASLNAPDTIGFGIKKLPLAGGYELFEVAISDWNAAVNPDSIVVAFFSSNPDSALAGGIFFVDQVIIDFATSVETPDDKIIGINIFPNPTDGIIKINFNKPGSFEQLQVISSTGKIILTKNISGLQSYLLDIEKLPVGLYLLEFKNEKGEVFRKNIVKS